MHYSVKMRASREGRHISGAERIVGDAAPSADPDAGSDAGSDVALPGGPPPAVDAAVLSLLRRAYTHPHGAPDAVNISVLTLAAPPLRLLPLPVTQPLVRNGTEARALLEAELHHMGLAPAAILELFYSLRGMRGAALLHADTLLRLEPDPARGVRATAMDYEGNPGGGKDAFREALCLASKVAHCPHIIGELCMSDDPDYTTGYFASRERGYVRIPHIKAKGDPRGGRIFLFRGPAEAVGACMDYLQHQPVLVTALPGQGVPRPGGANA